MLADHLLTEHSDVPRQVVDELAARAKRLFERLPDEVLEAIPTTSRTCPGNYFFPVAIPAETLQRECGVLAMPVSVFGDQSCRHLRPDAGGGTVNPPEDLAVYDHTYGAQPRAPDQELVALIHG
jgi:hypothetical protein